MGGRRGKGRLRLRPDEVGLCGRWRLARELPRPSQTSSMWSPRPTLRAGRTAEGGCPHAVRGGAGNSRASRPRPHSRTRAAPGHNRASTYVTPVCRLLQKFYTR
jgi:hypothetical protein